MSTTRRYDIDWLRVIAIGLLLIYHVAIGFQSWGIMIGFISNDEPWVSLWIPMAMLNIWRIPFLFFVSGMGVHFAMQQRTWKQLLQERAIRIFLPFIFGAFCIYPVSVYIWQRYYGWHVTYTPHPGHLWFLGNIFVYVILLTPLFHYFKKNENGLAVKWISRVFSNPLSLIPVAAVFLAEALILQPNPYEMYAMTWHGFALGFLAFFFGYCFMLSGSSFWHMLVKWRWIFLVIATALFAVRMIYFQWKTPFYMIVAESDSWIFTVFAFGHMYLNRPGKVLTYLSEAAYPVYIIHMIMLFLGSMLIFPLEMVVQIKFVAVLLFTVAGCFLLYEFVIRRIKILRPLFGLKIKQSSETERIILGAATVKGRKVL